MAAPGPRPRPPLQVVREGNPGKRRVRAGVKVVPENLVEPDWRELIPRPRVPSRPKLPRGADDEARERHTYRLAQWNRTKVAAEGAEVCRARAAQEWHRVVPALGKTAGLGRVDHATVTDYCLTVARLEWCERRLSVEGLITMGQRGLCRNPLTTIATQYRSQLRAYIGELGLSPSARGRLAPPGDDDDGDDTFD